MNKFGIIVLVGVAAFLNGCNNGSSSSGANPYTGISPYPYPAAQSYATLPNGFSNAIPSFVPQTTLTTNGLQIAYGYNTNPAAERQSILNVAEQSCCCGYI